jgi:hypothetical protein
MREHSGRDLAGEVIRPVKWVTITPDRAILASLRRFTRWFKGESQCQWSRI